jgi:hypothetical protein
MGRSFFTQYDLSVRTALPRETGEQYGFVGIQVGLTALFGVLAGAFFFVALGWTGRPAKVRKVRTLSEDPDLF